MAFVYFLFFLDWLRFRCYRTDVAKEMQAAPLSPPAPAAAPFPRSEGSFGAGIEAAGTLDLLAALVDKSLVVYEEREDGRARYRLTETVRQYARDRLRESGAAASMRERHCHFFLALAEDAEPKLRGAEQSCGWGTSRPSTTTCARRWSGAAKAKRTAPNPVRQRCACRGRSGGSG
jgi:hypothetical protein